MTFRAAGLLLHPTSLPGRYGVGDLGAVAHEFLEWSARGGQRIWQILPLGPTGVEDAPYSSLSSYAGNPLLISPDALAEEGLLDEIDLRDVPDFPADRVAFAEVGAWKRRILRRSWSRFRETERATVVEEFERFAFEQAGWLEDWALFAALRGAAGGRPWTQWDRDLVRREPKALQNARRDLAGEIAYETFLQFLFFRQWDRLREHAERLGIRIVGDLPIYVAHDSADVWIRPDLFALDSAGLPEKVAGVPPDYFSETGQLWGNPVYRWDRIEAEGFGWWVRRLRGSLRLVHLLRLDHFRGFAAYWEIEAGLATAAHGCWVPGPGIRLFDAVRAELGSLPFLAEDLGLITPDVHELREVLGLPGMRVLQFGFAEDDSDHLPHRHMRACVVYTGTHDNDTTRGWFDSLGGEERLRLRDYLGGDGTAPEWELIRAAYASVADLAVVPLQDVFGLGSDARMNTPGRPSGNWSWRAEHDAFGDAAAARLRRLAELTGRSGRREA